MAYEMFKILIIDDNAQSRLLYEKYLSNLHYQVITAKNGEEGLQSAFLEAPDIILLDIMMPGMSGFEVCSRLRAAPSTAFIPIVLLTGLEQAGARQKAAELGADDFISKAEPLSSVEGRIKMLLKKYYLTHTCSWLAELAGSTRVDIALRHALSSGRPFAMLFLDLDSMSQFTERVGFEAGDTVLWQLADVLNQEVRSHKQGDLIGYYGQDDFVIIAHPEYAEAMAQSVQQHFEAFAYNWTDDPTDRSQFPTLSIAIVFVEDGRHIHPGQLSHVANRLIGQAKDQPGSTIATVKI